mmetsp:Transcript_70177/g.106169  ORF Transcript_70177/g.106169 Transcript_70177/m.106169 type:complete len:82 (-) Transcript_70177:1069-1314(-)
MHIDCDYGFSKRFGFLQCQVRITDGQDFSVGEKNGSSVARIFSYPAIRLYHAANQKQSRPRDSSVSFKRRYHLPTGGLCSV